MATAADGLATGPAVLRDAGQAPYLSYEGSCARARNEKLQNRHRLDDQKLQQASIAKHDCTR